MKNFIYLSAIFILCSCTQQKKESNPNIVQTPDGINGLQKNVVTPVASSTRSNLIYNPAHGKPGHTCALAVGAPLHQTAVTQPQKPITAIPPVSATIPAKVNSQGKKLNPKHGDPGHRCDIAVGAPLYSKPAAIATTVSPAKPTTVSSAPIKVAKGMNPPHGQPNHRCDIAVGAPLT